MPALTAIKVQNLREQDLADAEVVRRLAFGSHMGLADPMQFDPGGSSMGRFYAEPEGTRCLAGKIFAYK